MTYKYGFKSLTLHQTVMVEPIKTLFNLIMASFGYKYLKLMIYVIERILKMKNKMVAKSLYLCTSYFAVELSNVKLSRKLE